MGNKQTHTEFIPIKFLDNIKENQKIVQSIKSKLTNNIFIDLNKFDIHTHIEYILLSNNYINDCLIYETLYYLKLLILKNPILIEYQNNKNENILLYSLKNFKNWNHVEMEIIDFLFNIKSDFNLKDCLGHNSLYYLFSNLNIDRYYFFKKILNDDLYINSFLKYIFKYQNDDSLLILKYLINLNLNVNYNLVLYYILRYHNGNSYKLLKILLKNKVKLNFIYKNIKIMDYISFLYNHNMLDQKILEIFFIFNFI